MKKAIRYQQIKKIASKVGKKGAKGMNFSHAQNQLSEANPGMEFSRDEITRKISEKPLFSEESLDSIFEIEIEDHHAERLNRVEKAFIEIGAFLTKKLDHINEIGDYLISQRAEPGWVSERYNVSLVNSDSLIEEFNKLNTAQVNWHREEAAKAAEIEEKEGLFGNGYMTNEIVYDFGDGWSVVYVPAIGEGPNYRGDNKKSNDRTIEGNLNGLCLGATQGLYQNNNSGKIYSVRDPKNNPRVTIRISDESTLREAKGKNNLPPSIEGALHANEWFETLDNLRYKDSYDYRNFPPLTLEDAKNKLNSMGSRFFIQKGYATHWYRNGVDNLDEKVEQYIEEKDIVIIYSGLGKKYKELVEPVAKYWAEKWITEGNGGIFADFRPEQPEQLSHESWKVYKKKSWMKAAVEKLMEENPRFGFKIGIHLIFDYREYGEIGAKNIAEDNPLFFFELKLNETYPEIGVYAAKKILNDYPTSFFRDKLFETYPELKNDAANAAKELLKNKPLKFFDYKLFEVYPELKNEAANAAKRVLENDVLGFFDHKINEIYPELEFAAVKKLSENYPLAFFRRDVVDAYKQHDDYAEIERNAAERLSAIDAKEFFGEKLKLHEKYPEFIKNENVQKLGAERFFELKLGKDFPEVAKKFITASEKNWGRHWPYGGSNTITLYYFFTDGAYRDFPEVAKKWITRFVSDYPNQYFASKIHIEYPEEKRTAAESLVRSRNEGAYTQFFNANLEKDFPELALKLINKILDSGESYLFFELKLNEKIKTIELEDDLIKDLENRAIEAVADAVRWSGYTRSEVDDKIQKVIYRAYPRVEAFKKLFAILKRADLQSYYIFVGLSINPNYNRQQEVSNNEWLKETLELVYKEDPIFLYNLFKFFKNSDADSTQSLTELLPEDFFKNIARIIAREDPDLFFRDELDKYNVEAKTDALKEMSKIDFIKWINFSGHEKIYLDYMNDTADSSLQKINLQLKNSEYFAENNIDGSSFQEFKDELFSNYLSRFIYPDREVLLEMDIDPENFDQEYLLESTVDEENIKGAVLGFVSWGIDNLVKNIEEEEYINVKDILNRYIETFYSGSFSSTEFENIKEIGYNLRAQLEGYSIKRDMRRDFSANIYEEEAEGIYQEEDVYNPMQEMFDSYDKVEEDEVEEDDEEELDKLSKLYNYLIKSGFSKEAEILKEFTKVAVLKRLKRTTRGKGKRDRMEWALVSKSNPKKILKWFGPDKPTKKEIAKEERRVHAFG